MENNYDKNMEALLKKAFLSQDLEAAKNEKLLAATSGSTLGKSTVMGFISKFGIIGGSLILVTMILGTYLLVNYAQGESKYQPATLQLQLLEERDEFTKATLPMAAPADLTATFDAPVPKRKKTPPVKDVETPKEEEIKVYTPDYEEEEYPTLKAEQVKVNNKLKEDLIKDLLRLDKKKYVEILAFTHVVRVGEDRIVDFAAWSAEVTNLEYRIFLNDLIISKRFDEYKLARVNNKGWTEWHPLSFLEPMNKMYHWHPAYNEYPVVNISRKGAELFCEWISAEIRKSDKNKNGLASVQIPTNRQWEYLASSGHAVKDYPWGGPYVQNEAGCFLANFKPGSNYKSTCMQGKEKSMDDVALDNTKNLGPYVADGGLLTVKVDSYNPNKFGIYNAAGNVSEMVYYPYEGGKIGARGGNWDSGVEEIKIYAEDPFIGVDKASPLIGFRPVITYLRETTNGKEPSEDRLANPSLTEEDIQKNNKRKAELTKHIIKMNHDYYTDVIQGSMELEGEKVNINNIIAHRMEVSVLDFKTFLFDLIVQKRFDEFHEYKPKRETWGVDSGFYEFAVQDYLVSPGFHDYPILNISADAANAYCSWLFEETKLADSRDKLERMKGIRLPTYDEWMYLATNGGKIDNGEVVKELQQKTDADSMLNFCDNFKSGRNPDKSLRDKFIFTGPVIGCTRSETGLYNLIGNAAEMVIYKDGTYGTKGGSWNSSALELDFYAVDSTKGNLSPNAEIGFRFVLEWGGENGE